MADTVVRFLEGLTTDGRGKQITEILDQDDWFWENNHDFIQWLFPLDEESSTVRNSPVLNERRSSLSGPQKQLEVASSRRRTATRCSSPTPHSGKTHTTTTTSESPVWSSRWGSWTTTKPQMASSTGSRASSLTRSIPSMRGLRSSGDSPDPRSYRLPKL